MSSYLILSPEWPDYALVDSGAGRRLERFGGHLLIRPEPKAWWRPRAPAVEWNQAAAEHLESGQWRVRDPALPRAWTLRYGALRLEARLTDMSKHIGIFPEQEPHWRWLGEQLRQLRQPQVLNLFGYTGAATLAAAAAGAAVTHVDASKPALAWARRNQELSGLAAAPIRWLLDDAFKFAGRELRRGRRYDAILLDPPSFGRGPKGEIWKVERQIGELLSTLRQLLPPERGLLLLTLYNLEASALMLEGLLRDSFAAAHIEVGELVLPSGDGTRRLPLSLFARLRA
jgi:23S rRNA (cytosine1962-C5)-methyltransferase